MAFETYTATATYMLFGDPRYGGNHTLVVKVTDYAGDSRTFTVHYRAGL